MVDRQARDILGNALTGFMREEIRSNEFDRTVFPFSCGERTEDPAVISLSEVLYTLYDDLRNDTIHVTEEVWHALRRVLTFMRTDLPYSYGPKDLPAKWEAVRAHWPFADDTEWQANKHLMTETIPEYDIRLRPRPCKSTLRAACEVMAMLLAAIALLVGVFLLLNWLR